MVTADAAFDTVQIKLEQPDTQRRISEYSPSGKVPALLLDSVVINDSLAISEYIAEAYPDANLWPRDTRLRALARSAAAEMHSGFTHLRTQMAFGLALATMRVR
jgi:glutathione S-transferase